MLEKYSNSKQGKILLHEKAFFLTKRNNYSSKNFLVASTISARSPLPNLLYFLLKLPDFFVSSRKLSWLARPVMYVVVNT